MAVGCVGGLKKIVGTLKFMRVTLMIDVTCQLIMLEQEDCNMQQNLKQLMIKVRLNNIRLKF